MPPSFAATYLVAHYGYWAVFGFVALESSGLPLPGEATLIAAAIYAGDTQQLDIVRVILCAAAGAILGDNLGFWVGRRIGMRLLQRHGKSIRLNERRLKLGQDLFLHHGGKIVFFGRFVAVLRAFAAVLAGANGMAWGRFLVFNALGGILWATLHGSGAYLFGKAAHRVAGPVGIALLALALTGMVVATIVIRRHEQRLEDEAERAMLNQAKRRDR